MGNEFPEKLNILLVEDNPGDRRLIMEMMNEDEKNRFNITETDKLKNASNLLKDNQYDIILLDLHLPDCFGLVTLETILQKVSFVPIIVLTGTDDETTIMNALKKGAQDYLVKGKFNWEVLIRSIRYAIERVKLLKKLEKIRQEEEEYRAEQAYNRFIESSKTQVTSKLFGVIPFREAYSADFETIVNRYSDLLKQSIERQLYKVELNLSDQLRELSEILGGFNCGPRDVIDIHSTAFKRLSSGLNTKMVRAFANEGKLLSLELMGYLVSYYRKYTIGVR